MSIVTGYNNRYNICKARPWKPLIWRDRLDGPCRERETLHTPFGTGWLAALWDPDLKTFHIGLGCDAVKAQRHLGCIMLNINPFNRS